jgi:hypothetical protein
LGCVLYLALPYALYEGHALYQEPSEISTLLLPHSFILIYGPFYPSNPSYTLPSTPATNSIHASSFHG